jgi:HK97 family phage prohead protease
MTPTTERRQLTLDATGFTVRAEGDDAPRFTGYASKFNERTAIGNPLTWGFYEQVADSAFTKTLAEADVRFLVDHDSRMIVARKSAGDLALSADKVGLAVDAELDTELSYVRDLVRNLEKRRITGMSFGFEVVKDQWDVEQVETNDGNTADVEVRTLLEVKLWEVSAVTFPAYDSTEAQVRSVATALTKRGDGDAIRRHAEFKPELLRYTEVSEPGRSTRTDTKEPTVVTPAVVIDLAMRGYAALYGLPRA